MENKKNGKKRGSVSKVPPMYGDWEFRRLLFQELSTHQNRLDALQNHLSPLEWCLTMIHKQ